jgi:U4/U6 small nuclear ribonucleoprotein PRP4
MHVYLLHNTVFRGELFFANFIICLRSAKERLQRALTAAEDHSSKTAAAVRMQETHKLVRRLQIHGSQIGDVRPVCYVTFNEDGTQCATAGWSGECTRAFAPHAHTHTGMCTVWSIPNCARVRNLRAHNAPASCVRFTPNIPDDPNVVHLASSGQDGGVFLWDGVRLVNASFKINTLVRYSESPLSELLGHTMRVNRVQFHPSGRFLATVWYVRADGVLGIYECVQS